MICTEEWYDVFDQDQRRPRKIDLDTAAAAYLYHAVGKKEKAVECMEKAILLSPNNEEHKKKV